MTPEACRAWRGQLAASLLGALGRDEEVALRAHLDGCASCRAESAELGAVVALLALADVDRVRTPPAAPATLGDRVAGRVAEERLRSRRRRRTRIGVTAVGIAAALALVGLLLTIGRGAEPVGLRFAGPPGITASATLVPRAWGTQIELELAGLPAGETFGVWLERPGGDRTPAGTFVAVAGRRMHLVLGSGLGLDEATGLGISSTAGGETILYSELPATD